MITVTTKVRKSKTKSEPKYVPMTPGKLCPNCGQKYKDPIPGNNGTYPGWDSWNEDPHENPFDCIRALRKSLEDLKSEIEKVDREWRRCI